MNAIDVIKVRLSKTKNLITTSLRYACYYARDVIKGRFPEGERVILNSEYAEEYQRLFRCKTIEFSSFLNCKKAK